MQSLLAFFIFASLLALPASADIRSCQSLYNTAPKKLGGFALTGSKNYEKKQRGAGFSLQYGKVGSNWVTLYFYDKRRQRINKRRYEGEAAEVFATAAQVRLGSFASGPAKTIGQKHPIRFEGGENFPNVVTSQARIYFEPEGQPVTNDYVTMGVVENCFVKMRYSSLGNRASSDRRFEKVKSELKRNYP